MEWLWFNEPVEVSGPRASLVKAEASEFRISLKQKENQTINTRRRRSQAGWSPALLVSVFLFLRAREAMWDTAPDGGPSLWPPARRKQRGETISRMRQERGKRWKRAALSWASQQCSLSAFIVALKCTILLHFWGKLWKSPNFSILMVELDPSVPLDQQDTENQVHHWDRSSVLSYSVSTYMTMVVWLLVAKSHKQWGYFLQSCHLKLLWVIWLDL